MKAEHVIDLEDEVADLPDDEPPVRYGMAYFHEQLEEDLLNDLQELRQTCMASSREMKARQTVEPENLTSLNAGIVKVARAVRQIGVLQLEIAGLRQPAQTRGPVAANGNAPAGKAQQPGQGGSDDRTRGDYNDYNDDKEHWYGADEEYWPPLSKAEAEFNESMDRVCAALDADFEAAGIKEQTDRASKADKVEIYAYRVPHPTLDECIKTVRVDDLFAIFGIENLRVTLGPGPPAPRVEEAGLNALASYPLYRLREREGPAKREGEGACDLNA